MGIFSLPKPFDLDALLAMVTTALNPEPPKRPEAEGG